MPVPPDFANRKLSYQHVDAAKLMRIFRTPPTAHPAPVYYGDGSRSDYRFDPPSTAVGPDRFGVMYAAYDLETCFAETITREDNRKPLKFGALAVSYSGQVVPRYVADLDADMPLRLADVTDLGLYSLGADAAEFNSANYPVDTQPWALEIFRRPETVDGIYYRSRFLNGRIAVAIFERGGLRIGLRPSNVTKLTNHGMFTNVLRNLNVSLLP